jgi:sialidase-1
MGHLAFPFSRIVMQRSFDEGCNWTRKTYIEEILDVELGGAWNNPRIINIGGTELILICDWLPPKCNEGDPKTEIYIWRSIDAGSTWSERQETGIRGHICPCVTYLKNKSLIIAGDQNCNHAPDDKNWRHNAFISKDAGKTFEGPYLVAHNPNLYLNEGSIFELPDGTLVDYLREDKVKECAYKCVSSDSGITWAGPFKTRLIKCVGRPKAGILASGDIAISYGFDLCPRNLILHIEHPFAAALAADIDDLHERRNEESFHYLRFPIDHDRSVFADGGYSGWVNLPGGDVFMVQYIVDDAPMAQIRGYRISSSDYILVKPRSPMPEFNWIERFEAHEKVRGVTDHGKLEVSPYHDYFLSRLEELEEK